MDRKQMSTVKIPKRSAMPDDGPPESGTAVCNPERAAEEVEEPLIESATNRVQHPGPTVHRCSIPWCGSLAIR